MKIDQRFKDIVIALRSRKQPIGLGGCGIWDGEPEQFTNDCWLFDNGDVVLWSNYTNIPLESYEEPEATTTLWAYDNNDVVLWGNYGAITLESA